eukprot:TRINITY_DN2497_c0_g1_i1.p1 TRINITY_DN2497_c0_g1~~TRINITY_DN2497_c0_g1_i1.p1  ORF type:complete len:64 (-),score=20.22 TRINITY_DN2497_c0_g1_i1:304-495(-)
MKLECKFFSDGAVTRGLVTGSATGIHPYITEIPPDATEVGETVGGSTDNRSMPQKIRDSCAMM